MPRIKTGMKSKNLKASDDFVFIRDNSWQAFLALCDTRIALDVGQLGHSE